MEVRTQSLLVDLLGTPPRGQSDHPLTIAKMNINQLPTMGVPLFNLMREALVRANMCAEVRRLQFEKRATGQHDNLNGYIEVIVHLLLAKYSNYEIKQKRCSYDRLHRVAAKVLRESPNYYFSESEDDELFDIALHILVEAKVVECEKNMYGLAPINL